jgi:hypothetical protein
VGQHRLQPALPGVRSSGLATCSGVEGSGPQWVMPVKGEFAPVRGASRVVVVTTMFMRVLVEKVLIPGIDGLEPNTRVPLC